MPKHVTVDSIDPAGAADGDYLIYNASLDKFVPSSSPLGVAGLELWLDANTISAANNDPIATWADQSGNSRDATQATTAKKPLWIADGGATINNKPVLRFDGTDDLMTVADDPALDLGTGEGMTVFVVGKSTRANSDRFVGKPAPVGNGRWLIYHPTSGVANYFIETTAGTDAVGSTVITNNFHILTGGRDSDGTTIRIRVDGTSEGTASRAGDASNANALDVGGDSGASKFLQGDIAEILVYSVGLSSADLDTVGGYLSSKYGLDWTLA